MTRGQHAKMLDSYRHMAMPHLCGNPDTARAYIALGWADDRKIARITHVHLPDVIRLRLEMKPQERTA